jgi:hypothetical protein
MTAYRYLYKSGIVGVKAKCDTDILNMTALGGTFGELSSREIEDLLCHLEKSIKRLKGGKLFTSKNPYDYELDTIVKETIDK